MIDLRAWGRARALGAVREAEHLGCPMVATGHLLLVSLNDPVVRWALRTVGVDTGAVAEEVARTTTGRGRPRVRWEGITPVAAEAVMRASEGSSTLDHERPLRDEVAVVLQALAGGFLSRTRPSDARDLLDGFGVIEHRARVLATLQQNARPAGAGHLAPGDGDGDGDGDGQARSVQLGATPKRSR